jgi:hypothetical protein
LDGKVGPSLSALKMLNTGYNSANDYQTSRVGRQLA